MASQFLDILVFDDRAITPEGKHPALRPNQKIQYTYQPDIDARHGNLGGDRDFVNL